MNGNNGGGRACGSGDCGGVVNCVNTVSLSMSLLLMTNSNKHQGETPVTLAEFDLAGGSNGDQTFYDISLVDGYNMPIGITYIPGDTAALQEIPPNLTNCACIATSGLLAAPAATGSGGNSSNTTYPIPYEPSQTSAQVADWCPWDLQVNQPTKPGDGVYPYPDDSIQRPDFDPCLSACAKTNAPADCCTGKYDSSSVCKPNLYSTAAKAVCPDAYSFAFDDQTSTFIIPSGGGWEVTFCPTGRSTNILATLGPQLQALGQSGGKVTNAIKDATTNITFILENNKSSAGNRANGESMNGGSVGALVIVVAAAALLW